MAVQLESYFPRIYHLGQIYALITWELEQVFHCCIYLNIMMTVNLTFVFNDIQCISWQ